MTKPVEVSAIVVVAGRLDDVSETYRAYKAALETLSRPYEFVYVLDGQYPEVLATLKELRAQDEPIKIISLSRWSGEGTALMIGHAHSRGQVILTLPAYLQVEPVEIPRIVAALDRADMVAARRFPRRDSRINVLQSRIFHFLLRIMGGHSFVDLGCGVRALKRHVLEDLNIYGEQHRFLPLFAHAQGFKVVELDAAQASQDAYRRVYPLGLYVRRLLDILTVAFITRFTKKPLRFFGLLGAFTFLVGMVAIIYLIVERLFFGVALADRPAFVLTVVTIVLGVQLFAVGLIGELIIFTHASDIKEYTIDQVVE